MYAFDGIVFHLNAVDENVKILVYHFRTNVECHTQKPTHICHRQMPNQMEMRKIKRCMGTIQVATWQPGNFPMLPKRTSVCPLASSYSTMPKHYCVRIFCCNRITFNLNILKQKEEHSLEKAVKKQRIENILINVISQFVQMLQHRTMLKRISE